MPVTVLKVDNCQVVAVRTAGEGRLYRRAARRRQRQGQERHASRSAAISPRRRSSRSASSPNSASSDDALLEVGAEITAAHFVPGQYVDVTGISIGKGFAGAHEALEFRGLRATPRRVGLAPQPRLDRQRQDPGKTFKNKKMAGHLGAERVTTQNLEGRRGRCRARPDHGQGRGARAPTAAGCWSRRGQAQGARRKLPFPGLAAAARRRAAAEAGAEREGAGMKLRSTISTTSEVGDIELAEEVFGLPVRRDILARVVNWQLAKRRAGTHKTKGVSEIAGTTKKPYSRRAPAAPARAACARRNSAAAR